LFKPFLVVANSIPRIALIPIIVLIFGPTLKSSIANVALVVFFLTFYNALEGGRSVRSSMIENAMLLGASRFQIMTRLRLPYVLMWTIAVIPNAIAFGLVIAVTNELLTGLQGMGALLLTATSTLNSGETFGIIVILAAVGVILYAISSYLGRRAVGRLV
jgi:NitT/TauT family transport system permease protein